MRKFSEINNNTNNTNTTNININNKDKNNIDICTIDKILNVLENAKYNGIDKMIENLTLEKSIILEKEKINMIKNRYDNDNNKVKIIINESSKKIKDPNNCYLKYLATKDVDPEISEIYLNRYKNINI